MVSSIAITIGCLLSPIDTHADPLTLENIAMTGTRSANVITGKAGGIKFEFHGSGQSSLESANNSIRLNSGQNTLTINLHNDHIALNGKSRGSIKTGDFLLLDESGQLYVNEKKR